VTPPNCLLDCPRWIGCWWRNIAQLWPSHVRQSAASFWQQTALPTVHTPSSVSLGRSPSCHYLVKSSTATILSSKADFCQWIVSQIPSFIWCMKTSFYSTCAKFFLFAINWRLKRGPSSDSLNIWMMILTLPWLRQQSVPSCNLPGILSIPVHCTSVLLLTYSRKASIHFCITRMLFTVKKAHLCEKCQGTHRAKHCQLPWNIALPNQSFNFFWLMSMTVLVLTRKQQSMTICRILCNVSNNNIGYKQHGCWAWMLRFGKLWTCTSTSNTE